MTNPAGTFMNRTLWLALSFAAAFAGLVLLFMSLIGFAGVWYMSHVDRDAVRERYREARACGCLAGALVCFVPIVVTSIVLKRRDQ